MDEAGAPEKLKVFISYSRRDMAFADRLVDGLKARGFEVRIESMILLDSIRAAIITRTALDRQSRIARIGDLRFGAATEDELRAACAADPLGETAVGAETDDRSFAVRVTLHR